MTSRYKWKKIFFTDCLEWSIPKKQAGRMYFARTIKVTSMFWITNSTAGNTLSNLLFIRAKQELRDIATADPLKLKRNKKVLVVTIIPRFPLTIQGHQIKRREPLVTLSLRSQGSLPRNRAICLAGITIVLRLDSSRSFYIASRDPEISFECNTLNIMYHRK